MIQQSFVARQLMGALYEATLLEMLSAGCDEYPAYFAVRGRGLAALVGGKWSSYRRAQMRKLAKRDVVIIEYHFGSLVYRIHPEWFAKMHDFSKKTTGDFSIRLPNPLQLSFVS